MNIDDLDRERLVAFLAVFGSEITDREIEKEIIIFHDKLSKMAEGEARKMLSATAADFVSYYWSLPAHRKTELDHKLVEHGALSCAEVGSRFKKFIAKILKRGKTVDDFEVELLRAVIFDRSLDDYDRAAAEKIYSASTGE